MPLTHDSFRRWVVLLHRVGPSFGRTRADHLDWMFERSDGMLRTWATPPVDRFDEPLVLSATRLADHRHAYLDREGQVSGDRGHVTRLMSGEFRMTESDDAHYRFVTTWHDDKTAHSAEITIYRKLALDSERRDESCDDWLLRFSPG